MFLAIILHTFYRLSRRRWPEPARSTRWPWEHRPGCSRRCPCFPMHFLRPFYHRSRGQLLTPLHRTLLPCEHRLGCSRRCQAIQRDSFSRSISISRAMARRCSEYSMALRASPMNLQGPCCPGRALHPFYPLSRGLLPELLIVLECLAGITQVSVG